MSADDREPRPPERRGNGLSAPHYAAVADLDPRVAGELLGKLREAGVAAYVSPTPGRVGGYRELQLPSRPTDRLFVASDETETARRLVAAETGATSTPVDEQQAFAQIVASYDEQGDPGERSWPDSEDVPVVSGRPLASPRRFSEPAPFRSWSPPTDPLDEHFVPPAPPPLPRFRRTTAWAVLALVGGALLLIVPSLLGHPVGPGLSLLGVVGIVGGFLALVWGMRDHHDDSGSDDGARV
jgi:hypothetical protein